MFLHFCQWLASQPSSVALHKSLWAYPIIESVHVIALCLFFGFAVLLDLRLLGVTLQEEPVSDLAERLLPWTVLGFGLMVISGALLFYSNPVKFYGNVFFRIKGILFILAGLNVLIFHTGIYRRVGTWDLDPITPRAAKIAGAASLFFWTAIIVTGRMIAYNWFDK